MRPERLLVVLDDCGPGDTLLVNFCLAAVRRARPDARIDCLASGAAAPMLEMTGIFDRVIISHIYDRPTKGAAWRGLRKAGAALGLALRLAGRYDGALTFYWGSTLLNLVAWAAAPFHSTGYANRLRTLVRGGLGRYDPASDPVIQAVALMKAFGVAAQPAVAVIQPSPPRTHALPRRLHGSRYAVLHAGSDWACQMWLPERWAELGDRVAVDLGLLPVFTGVDAEAEDVERIRSLMSSESLSTAGSTSVAELAALVEEASLCVSVDTVTFELARAAGTPAVVLAGQSRATLKPRGTGPASIVNLTSAEERRAILDCKVKVVKAAYGACQNWDCPMSGLRDIAVADVLAAIQEVLARRAPALEGAGA